MTPRDNLLRTLRCDQPRWIPVCLHLFPNENATHGVPAELQNAFQCSWLGRDLLTLGAYLEAEDYLLPVDAPAELVSDTCLFQTEPAGTGKWITFLATPHGKLRQVTETPEGYPSLVTERFVKTPEDAQKLTAYFQSLRVRPLPDNLKKIRELKGLCGDKGVLFLRAAGTPLGMCYRVYSDLTNLVYLLADAPGIMKALFDCMEEQYLRLYDAMLRAAPEIDMFLGMDDTSTTLISPAMFEAFNVALTNRRADLCHAHGKLYLHHSCGLIRNLLPIYRQTRMDGVDAFTPPPIGDVGYAEGRTLLGPKYSMISGLGGPLSLSNEAMAGHVAARFADARSAGNIVFSVGGARLTFAALEFIFAEAQQRKREL